MVAEASDPPAVAFALLLHAVNLLTYISTGLVGLWAQDVSLGEVTRAAQLVRSRQRAESGDPAIAKETP